MRKVVLVTFALLALAFSAAVGEAQNSETPAAGVKATHARSANAADEQIRKEIAGIETDKVPLLLKGGPEYADYFDRHDADGVAITLPDGSLQTKSEASTSYRSGSFKVLSMKQFDHHVHVFNGTTAVVTYHGIGVFETDGKKSDVDLIFDDVWVKENGNWLRVVHNIHNAPKGPTGFHP